MKKYVMIFVAVMLFCNITTHAQSVYFPSEEGLTVEYVTKNAKDKVTGYISYKFHEIDWQDESNFTVRYQVLTMNSKHKETSQPVEATAKVVNGTVYLDATSAFSDVASALGQMSEIMVMEGNGLVIPSDVTTGQKLEDAHVTIGGMVSSSCTNITATALEELTTEAGTFQTVRLDMDVAGKVLIIKFEGTSTQWCAKGIGLVRAIHYDKKAKVTSSMELVKII